MPYKRKVRVLFLASGDPGRALLAVALTQRLGAAQLEARAHTWQASPLSPELKQALGAMEIFPESLSAECAIVDRLDSATLAWADLVLTLDQTADQLCPPLPATVQKRCYPCAPLNLANLETVRVNLEARIAGILGGLAMMA